MSVPRIRLAPPVVDFVRRQAREPRHRLRRALRALVGGKGDLKPLEDPLQDYWRLRVGPYRIIVRYATPKTIECVFVERHNIIYEVFAEAMLDRLAGAPDDTDEDDEHGNGGAAG